jgi:hypothetical protein
MEPLVLAYLQDMAGPESDFYRATRNDSSCGLTSHLRPDLMYDWVTRDDELMVLDDADGKLSDNQERRFFQIVEVDEGGVEQHNAKKCANQGMSHDQWADEVAKATGVGGQVVRIGVAHNKDMGAPVENRFFKKKNNKYELIESMRTAFEAKLERVLEALESYRVEYSNSPVVNVEKIEF